MFWFLYQVCKYVFVLIFPFILLIRGSVYLHHEYNLVPYACVLGGVILTAVLLFIYLTFFFESFTGKYGSSSAFKRRVFISFFVVSVYVIHGVLFFNTSNFKTAAIKEEVTDLHPILRLSLSTLIHLDKDLVVTDASRKSSDYSSWGMKENKSSLHYKQSDGYVYAVDIRTKNRSEFKNTALALYFWMMGFDTLRHYGTADHLHIGLK